MGLKTPGVEFSIRGSPIVRDKNDAAFPRATGAFSVAALLSSLAVKRGSSRCTSFMNYFRIALESGAEISRSMGERRAAGVFVSEFDDEEFAERRIRAN